MSQSFREAAHPWEPWQPAQGGDPLFSWPAAASCLKPGGHEFWGSSVSLPETPLGLFTLEPLHGLAGLEGARARAARGQGDPRSQSHPVTPVSKHRTLGWPLAKVKREEFMQETHRPSPPALLPFAVPSPSYWHPLPAPGVLGQPLIPRGPTHSPFPSVSQQICC